MSEEFKVDKSEVWQGSEEWEPLAYALCADECGEESCNQLIWESGEPWGERWLKYEDEAKGMISLVRENTAHADTEALRQRVAELEGKVSEYSKRIVAIGGIAINSIPRNSYDGMVATQSAMIVRLQEAIKAAYFEAWYTLAARYEIPMNGDDEKDFAESEAAKFLTAGVSK